MLSSVSSRLMATLSSRLDVCTFVSACNICGSSCDTVAKWHREIDYYEGTVKETVNSLSSVDPCLRWISWRLKMCAWRHSMVDESQ